MWDMGYVQQYIFFKSKARKLSLIILLYGSSNHILSYIGKFIYLDNHEDKI